VTAFCVGLIMILVLKISADKFHQRQARKQLIISKIRKIFFLSRDELKKRLFFCEFKTIEEFNALSTSFD
jgi:hypothetical protein